MLPNLKLLRQEYGLSQQRLADAIGVSQPSINKYENHDIEPDIQILSKLADFFNTSIDYLVGHTDVRRRIEHTEPFHLNREETALMTRFRSLTKEEKACIEMTIQTFLKR